MMQHTMQFSLRTVRHKLVWIKVLHSAQCSCDRLKVYSGKHGPVLRIDPTGVPGPNGCSYIEGPNSLKTFVHNTFRQLQWWPRILQATATVACRASIRIWR